MLGLPYATIIHGLIESGRMWESVYSNLNPSDLWVILLKLFWENCNLGRIVGGGELN